MLHFAWFGVAMLLLSGCRYGLPNSEIHMMMGLEKDWETIVVSSENQFREIDRRHAAFVLALSDTSNYLRMSQIQQDTALRLQITRLRERFDEAKRQHIYHLKEMRTFLDASAVWLQRINTEGMARQLARRSWQARTTTFKTLYERIEATQLAFEEIKPHYARIIQLLPSMQPLDPTLP